ncbi:MAG: peptide deformylase [Candidatus Krumholzibacteriota bacterium]
MNVRAARIRRYGHGCLRRRARPVDPADPRTAELLELLWTTLMADGGVGLAAPQIGRAERVAVVVDPEEQGEARRIELVNPVVRETFGPRVPFEEGCLSFPGLYTRVWRPRGVEVEFDGPQGKRILRSDALAARIMQHEIDHLDGVLFIDHLPVRRRILLLPRLVAYVVSEVWRKISGQERVG